MQKVLTFTIGSRTIDLADVHVAVILGALLGALSVYAMG